MLDHASVLLIGGAPGVGKTTLSRAVAARWGASSLTIDDVMVAARAITSDLSHPALHTTKRAGGHTDYFTNTAPEQLISDALELEDAVWPMVEALVASHVATGSRIVMDCWLLRPRVVTTLDNSRVASVWLYLENAALWERERRNTSFTAASADPTRMLDNFMHRSLWRNELVGDEAVQVGLPVLRLDGTESPDELVGRVLTSP